MSDNIKVMRITPQGASEYTYTDAEQAANDAERATSDEKQAVRDETAAEQKTARDAIITSGKANLKSGTALTDDEIDVLFGIIK